MMCVSDLKIGVLKENKYSIKENMYVNNTTGLTSKLYNAKTWDCLPKIKQNRGEKEMQYVRCTWTSEIFRFTICWPMC